jgi:hypothetical protein
MLFTAATVLHFSCGNGDDCDGSELSCSSRIIYPLTCSACTVTLQSPSSSAAAVYDCPPPGPECGVLTTYPVERCTSTSDSPIVVQRSFEGDNGGGVEGSFSAINDAPFRSFFGGDTALLSVECGTMQVASNIARTTSCEIKR